MENVFSQDNEKLNDLVISRAEEKISTELDGETVILDMTTGLYSGLDSVGTTIWNMMNNKVTFAALVDEMLQNYEVSKEQCVSDLCDFLNEMLKKKLIVV